MARQKETCNDCQLDTLADILNCNRYINWQEGNPPCWSQSCLRQTGGRIATHDDTPLQGSYDLATETESVFPRISLESLQRVIKKVAAEGKKGKNRTSREETRRLRAQVETMRKEGKGIMQIVSALGVSKRMIYNATTRLIKQGRIKPLHRTKEEIEGVFSRIEDLRKTGLSNKEITLELELSQTSVENLAHKLIVAGRIESRRKRK